MSGWELVCPKCNSKRWRCYNETSNIIGDLERVVGSLVCETCGHDWINIDPPIDDDIEPFTVFHQIAPGVIGYATFGNQDWLDELPDSDGTKEPQ